MLGAWLSVVAVAARPTRCVHEAGGAAREVGVAAIGRRDQVVAHRQAAGREGRHAAGAHWARAQHRGPCGEGDHASRQPCRRHRGRDGGREGDVLPEGGGGPLTNTVVEATRLMVCKTAVELPTAKLPSPP